MFRSSLGIRGSFPAPYESQMVEDRLWELAILVREQDRGKGLALRRNEHMRRVLDMRVYELLLLQLRMQLIWDGVQTALSSRGTAPPVSGDKIEVSNEIPLGREVENGEPYGVAVGLNSLLAAIEQASYPSRPEETA